MDNYYNSVDLANKLLARKTHYTGTLRSIRCGNSKTITNTKLKKGQPFRSRSSTIYILKWKYKKQVISITTKYHPKIVTVPFHQIKEKQEEIAKYNKYMSGIYKSDQMLNYHSSPRKSIRWYKRVPFHPLDVNIMKKYNTKTTLLGLREDPIIKFLHISPDLEDGRKLGKRRKLVDENLYR